MASSGLIFDLDGTLVDSLRGIAAALNRTLHDHGRDIHDHAAVRRFIGNGARDLLRRAAGGEITESGIDEMEATFKIHYAAAWRDGTDIYPGVPQMLEKLAAAGHRLAVLSNKPHPFTVEMVTTLFPGAKFDLVLGQRPEVPRKPDPAGALEIAAAFGLEPAACAMIGDSTMDLDTGKRAGMRTVAVTWGYHDREALVAAGADAMAEDAGQLCALLL
ncbi:HAD-IA family hydrolase [Luteolibacter ambystomatis]|uniref:phosphoglycolate phosphatase n=1 Tax=Luteolibacter ambystomatis TaxID=2824561 RepID=A0A975IZQ7_9BACT|nr:HAD-IA family hydrolase [Luteolibacter ambystomatis]QUE51238.1 HAD-IA family hydrolase [Luteolibacter ambystomatis]